MNQAEIPVQIAKVLTFVVLKHIGITGFALRRKIAQIIFLKFKASLVA